MVIISFSHQGFLEQLILEQPELEFFSTFSFSEIISSFQKSFQEFQELKNGDNGDD